MVKLAGIQDYWDALNRLKLGCTVRLPAGSPINKDTVALEAGRRRGSIKKSRKSFDDLITAIESAKFETASNSGCPQELLRRAKAEKQNYRELYHQALNRELMLVEKLAQLEKELMFLKKVVPIRD